MLQIYSKSFSNCTVVIALYLIQLGIGKKLNNLIYILQWTDQQYPIYSWYLKTGQESFTSRKCAYQNCYVTFNRTYMHILKYDVILFDIMQIYFNNDPRNWPKHRSENQLYIFVASEPAVLNPIDDIYNGIFNLTWTYKFKSDIYHPYFVIKNEIGDMIGPGEINLKVYDSEVKLNDTIKHKLENKNIAAAWVVSNCKSKKRLEFGNSLVKELNKFGHRVDIYGSCGNLSCERIQGERWGLLTNCYDKIENDYYFYLAFENSIGEDYVTEKVLHGLKHFSVPVVYGGADYERFLPDGSYLNGLTLGVEKLAKEMVNIINNKTRYYEFFKWHGYYTFEDTTDDNHRESICSFCNYLNDRRKSLKRSVYNNISVWWNEVNPDAGITDS